MTRACVLLSILLANSRAWPQRPPFMAASSASYSTGKRERFKFHSTLVTLIKHKTVKEGISHLLAAKQQQFPEAFSFLANVLWHSHEGV